MQNRRSWEGGSPSELEDVCRRKVAIRSFIEAGWSTYAEQIILPSKRAAATASSLQTVYDLAAKRRVGLRFNCKNLTSKCASLRFTCNRHRLKSSRQKSPDSGSILVTPCWGLLNLKSFSSFFTYRFETYNMLVNPNNRLVKKVLMRMVDSGDYFFFAISPNQSVTAFRSEIGQKTLAGLSANLRQIQGSTTADAQYQRALAQFRRRPDPDGQVLNWVCRDNLSYLDLTQNRLEMDPD